MSPRIVVLNIVIRSSSYEAKSVPWPVVRGALIFFIVLAGCHVSAKPTLICDLRILSQVDPHGTCPGGGCGGFVKDLKRKPPCHRIDAVLALNSKNLKQLFVSLGTNMNQAMLYFSSL
jgi:hypothetical protein